MINQSKSSTSSTGPFSKACFWTLEKGSDVLPFKSRRLDRQGNRRRSNLLKITLAFPVRHGAVEGRLLGLEEMEIVLDHVLAEGLPGEVAGLQFVNRFAQRARHLLQFFRRIHVALEDVRRLDLVADAIETGRQRGGIGQI